MVMDTAGAKLFCSNCGHAIKEKIAKIGPGWRAFSVQEENDRAHVGSPSSLAKHDMGLATVIGAEDRDASGKSLRASMKNTIERLRTWDGISKVHESVYRNRKQALTSSIVLLIN